MQNKDFTIAIVEDDLLISLNLVDRLESLGYPKIKTFQSGEEFLAQVGTLKPKVVIMDITLAGDLDGVDTVHSLKRALDIPVIFLTDHTDDQTFNRALSTAPASFMNKPFNDQQVARNIEIAITTYGDGDNSQVPLSLMENGLYVSRGEKNYELVKFQDITHIEADRAYCKLYTAKGKTETIARSMKSVYQLLSNTNAREQFVQVHRSFVINKNHITGIEGRMLKIGSNKIQTTEKYIPDLKQLFLIV